MVAQRQVIPPDRPVLRVVPRSGGASVPSPAAGPPCIGPYEILRTVVPGECVGLYAVRHTISRCEGGIRLLRPALADRQDFVQHFVREVRTLARVQHPAVLAILGVASDHGIPYAITDLLPRGTLAEHLRKDGTLPEATAIAVLRQLAGALAAVHDAGQAHGTLDPDSVLLEPSGQVTLLPHRDIRDAAGRSLVLAGGALGTPGAFPPERALGSPPTAAGDVYALGMLARTIIPRASWPAVAGLLDRCTAADPDARPASDELDTMLAALPVAPSPSQSLGRRVLSRERRGLRAGVALAGMGLAIMLIGNAARSRDDASAAAVPAQAATEKDAISAAPVPVEAATLPVTAPTVASHVSSAEERAQELLSSLPVVSEPPAAAAPDMPLIARRPADGSTGPIALLPDELFAEGSTRDVVAAINRANAVSVDAERTLDAAILAGIYDGAALDVMTGGVRALRAAGRRRLSVMPEIELHGVRLDGPDWAEVHTRERWRSEIVSARDGRRLSVQEHWYEQFYHLVCRDGRWYVTHNEILSESSAE
jgi:serine/threonine protein kinase